MTSLSRRKHSQFKLLFTTSLYNLHPFLSNVINIYVPILLMIHWFTITVSCYQHSNAHHASISSVSMAPLVLRRSPIRALMQMLKRLQKWVRRLPSVSRTTIWVNLGVGKRPTAAANLWCVPGFGDLLKYPWSPRASSPHKPTEALLVISPDTKAQSLARDGHHYLVPSRRVSCFVKGVSSMRNFSFNIAHSNFSFCSIS